MKSSSGAGVLVAVCFALFLNPFMVSSVGVALPAIGREFGASPARLGLIETAFLAAIVIALLPAGRLADRLGLEKVFLQGTALFTLSTVALGFAPTDTVLIGLRVVQGVAVAMQNAVGVAILTANFAKEVRGQVIGISIAAVYLGLTLGPFVGGWLVDEWGWRWIFHLSAAAGGISFALCLAGFDFSARHAAGIEAGGTLVRLFTGNRGFTLGNLVCFINYSASAAVIFTFSLYLQYLKDMSAKEAGLVLIIQTIIMAIFAPLAGRLSDRIGPDRLVTAGMALCTIGLGLTLLIEIDSGMAHIYGLLAFFGMGFALFSSANINQIMSSVGPAHFGIASSMVGTARTLGMLASISVASLAFRFYLGEREMSRELGGPFLDGVHLSFAIFLCLSVVGSVLSFGLIKKGKSNVQEA